MTFEQFQQTRKPCSDIGAAIQSDMGAPCPVTGFLYYGNLYITTRQDWWSEKAQREGAYDLILERDEYISDDLESLERKLYEWAVSYGAATISDMDGMRVDIFDDKDGAPKSRNVDLRECYPDDAEGYAAAYKALKATGEHVEGGGAWAVSYLRVSKPAN